MVKVFKFGGASVKDAAAVRNMASILSAYREESLVIVVSAMGKTTNALEALLKLSEESDHANFERSFDSLKKYHLDIAAGLHEIMPHDLMVSLETLFDFLHKQLLEKNCLSDRKYDQVVSVGELLSTTIVASWLESEKFRLQHLDARQFIKTDQRYRSANVNWEKTCEAIAPLRTELQQAVIMLTQGFIGEAPDLSTTTLGREGSDFSAAIFAFCLDAENVTIWKDVPGLLNADPKRFPQTVKIPSISYSEAIELSYYGATIIHPKTIKPLQNKGIELHIRSFLEPYGNPTLISHNCQQDASVASFIVKDNQLLVSISARDFSFMDEGHLNQIFGKLHHNHIHTNLLQTSALSLSLCLDDREGLADDLIRLFGQDFAVKYNPGLSLLTIRHYNEADINPLIESKTVLLEQRSRTTLQFVLA